MVQPVFAANSGLKPFIIPQALHLGNTTFPQRACSIQSMQSARPANDAPRLAGDAIHFSSVKHGIILCHSDEEIPFFDRRGIGTH